MNDTLFALFAVEKEGAPTVTEGGMLSTTKVPDVIAPVVLPAKSAPVFAAIEMAREPLPVKLLSTTVGEDVLPLSTFTVAVGVPANVIEAGVRLTLLAPE